MKNYALMLLAGLALLSGCKDDTRPDPVPVLNGSDYYPVAAGDYAIYEVVETLQLGAQTERDSFQVRERVDSLFTDLSGEPYYRVIRSRRGNATAAWSDDSVIVVKKTAQRVERQENNVRFIKLVFPMTNNRTWNANLMNTLEARNARYVEVNKPYTVVSQAGSELYPNTTLVLLAADSVSMLDGHLYYERYAKDMGLIEKRTRNVTYEPDAPFFGNYVIKTANIRVEKLLERGSE